MKPQGLPRLLRLRKRPDFERTYEMGAKRIGPNLVVFARRNSLGHRRLGVTATKKIGNAVARNTARRRIREAYRRVRQELPDEMDYVVVARRTALENTSRQLLPELVDLCGRAAGGTA